MLEQLTSVANEQLAVLDQEARSVGLEINTEKTEFMSLNQPPSSTQQISLNGKHFKKVTDFVYLGSRMSSSYDDFKRRLGLAWKTFWNLEKLWKTNHISLRQKLDIFKASVISVFVYGSETWIINSTMVDKINSFATSCYRVMLGVRKVDKIPNSTIYKMTNEKPLSISVQQRQLKWIGHPLRREPSEPSRIFAIYEPAHGKTGAGRPPLTYKQYICSLITTDIREATVQQLVDMASDRKKWRKMVADFGK